MAKTEISVPTAANQKPKLRRDAFVCDGDVVKIIGSRCSIAFMRIYSRDLAEAVAILCGASTESAPACLS